jgi:hypothetical protein
LDWPDEPVARLWHAVTLLREQRGDAHVAVLCTLGVSRRESNVLHADAGRDLKLRIEDTTDRLALSNASRNP